MEKKYIFQLQCFINRKIGCNIFENDFISRRQRKFNVILDDL